MAVAPLTASAPGRPTVALTKASRRRRGVRKTPAVPLEERLEALTAIGFNDTAEAAQAMLEVAVKLTAGGTGAEKEPDGPEKGPGKGKIGSSGRKGGFSEAEGALFSAKDTQFVANGVSFATEGVSFATDGVPFVTKGVPSVRDGVSFATNGVPFATDGVSSAPKGVPSVADGVSFPTDGVPSAADGVSFVTDGVPSAKEGVASGASGTDPDATRVRETALWWLLNRKDSTWKAHGLNAALKERGLYDPEKITLLPAPLPEPVASPFTVADAAKLPGDVKRGEAVGAKCFLCHRIGAQGVDYGPDLTAFGRTQTTEALLRSIIEPDADLAHGFAGTRLETVDGIIIEGLLLSESDPLVIRSAGGVTQMVPAAKVKAKSGLTRSLMMSAATLGLTAQEAADVTAYLRARK